jgi:hypothetical protein
MQEPNHNRRLIDKTLLSVIVPLIILCVGALFGWWYNATIGMAQLDNRLEIIENWIAINNDLDREVRANSQWINANKTEVATLPVLGAELRALSRLIERMAASTERGFQELKKELREHRDDFRQPKME